MSVTRTQNYPWRCVAPGTYTQDNDSFLAIQGIWNTKDKYGRRLHLLASCIKIQIFDIPDFENRLRKAWVTARYFFPGLAIRLGEYYKTYNVPTKVELDAWLNDTFRVPPFDTAEEFQKQHLSTEPYPQLHWFPKSKQLLIVAHHNNFDVTSVWYFWDSLLELVTSPKDVEFGDEWKNLPLARDDLLGLPKYPTVASYAKALDMVNKELKPGGVELPTLKAKISSDGEILPNGEHSNQFLRFGLSEAQTTAVVQSCKRRGVSVTSAFFAAISIVSRKIQSEHGTAGRYAICFHNFDSRAWFSKEYSTIRNAGNDLHTILPFAVDLEDKTFDEVLAFTDERFKSLRAEFSKDPTGLDALYHIVKGLVNPDGQIATFPNFTSFGVGDRIIKSTYMDGGDGYIRIDDWYQTIQNMVKGMNVLFLCNWHGKLQLGVGFNEAYHEEAMFRRLIEDSFDLVLSNFGLQRELLVSFKN